MTTSARPFRKASESYLAKLRDPRWQKRRLQILQRDEWTCQKCQETTETLHVHHRRYIRGRDPWEYEDSLLVTLCAPCHQVETDLWEEVSSMFDEILKAHMWAEDAHSLACDLHASSSFEYGLGHPAFTDVLGRTLRVQSHFNALCEKYFAEIKERRD